MIEDYYLVIASAWRNEAHAATGGVGLMLSREAQRSLISVNRSSDGVITASFQSNPVLTTIVANAQPLLARDEEKRKFYDGLRRAVEAVPRHHILAIIGDFDARLGRETFLSPFISALLIQVTLGEDRLRNQECTAVDCYPCRNKSSPAYL
ncbi:craniofacial development protein 2-like [Patiria miniata]|uniref:Uncharacterized protein n=1 Tax=Patiria miniata TaxID=46514 RepID=A0A914AL48_PATMI|nr:craniofacial development protein 2-like [Patiria miniata]